MLFLLKARWAEAVGRKHLHLFPSRGMTTLQQQLPWSTPGTASWTGLRTLRLCTRRTRADFLQRLPSISICSTVWGQAMLTELTSSSERLALPWGWSLFLWWCLRGGCCANWGASWTMTFTLSTVWWSCTGALSAVDCYQNKAPENATGNPFFLAVRRDFTTLYLMQREWQKRHGVLLSSLRFSSVH